jgi:hypothetical protein
MLSAPDASYKSDDPGQLQCVLQQVLAHAFDPALVLQCRSRLQSCVALLSILCIAQDALVSLQLGVECLG